MAISQLPAELPIALVPGDEVNFALRFNLDLTGYELAAYVYDSSQPTPTFLQFPQVAFEVEDPEVQGPEGEGEEEGPHPVTTLVEVSFDEAGTAQLSWQPARRWRWLLRWVSPGGVTRTILSGPINSRAP